MNITELRTALANHDEPAGVTGVRVVERDWVDSIAVVRNEWSDDDGLEGLTFEWDFSGRDDLAAELERYDAGR